VTVAYIALGSNLDDPVRQVRDGIADLGHLPDTTVEARSSLYRSRPVGPQDQPDYINAVVRLETALTAITLLHHMQSIELKHGRRRDGQHWGPRTLDLDLLLFGDETIALEELKVPHPEMARRAFVLQPLLDIAPAIRIPGLGPARQLLDGVDAAGLVRLD
jgi:2-amino-4-hydroxy-6-hydroxymethyldihydropteridine diphosphokinase